MSFENSLQMRKGLRLGRVTRSLGPIADSFARTNRNTRKNDNSYTWPNFELGIDLSQADVQDPLDIEPLIIDIDHVVAIDPALIKDSIVDVDPVLEDIDPNAISAHRISKRRKNCKIMADGSPAIYITPSRSVKRIAPFVNNVTVRASTFHSVQEDLLILLASTDESILIDTSIVSNSPQIDIFEGNCLPMSIDIPSRQKNCDSLSIPSSSHLFDFQIEEKEPQLCTPVAQLFTIESFDFENSDVVELKPCWTYDSIGVSYSR